MSAQADAGISLVKDGKYAEGIEKLSQALKSQPAPKWYIERSKAYLRTNDFELALHDAEQALSIAFKRANRDFMVDAQIRRTTALFRLERYADADVCALWAIKLVEGAKATEDDGLESKVDGNGDYSVTLKEIEEENQALIAAKKSGGLTSVLGNGGAGGRTKDSSDRNLAYTWRVNALRQMEQLDAGSPGRKVSVVKYPTPSEAPPPKSKVQTERVVELDDSEPEEELNKPKIPDHIIRGNVPVPSKEKVKWEWADVWEQFRTIHAKHDIRTDFYQSDSTLNISFFVKNVPKDDFKVDAQEQSVTMGPVPTIPSGKITLNLVDKIKPSETTYTVKPMKIELILKKAVSGKWKTLRQDAASMFDNIAIGQATHGTRDTFVAHAKSLGYQDPSTFSQDKFGSDLQAWYSDLLQKLARTETTRPSVPSHSAHASEPQAKENITPKAEPTTTPATSGPSYPTSSKSGPKNWDTMELDDDEKGEDVEDFFKGLYKNADPDMRRAMMKSYVESNGTSLSTSWAEAAKKDYTTEPPDSMEAKKWES